MFGLSKFELVLIISKTGIEITKIKLFYNLNNLEFSLKFKEKLNLTK